MARHEAAWRGPKSERALGEPERLPKTMSEEKKPDTQGEGFFVFPEWHNKIPKVFFGVIGPIATAVIIGAVWYYFSPRFTDVGYRPEQPVPYSHKLHAGNMEMDCRYCHSHVERSWSAGVPPTETCMNCHRQVRKDSPALLPVRESWATGQPIPWVRVHKVADYAYFNHAAHVNPRAGATAAIGCESCHGRIDQMVVVGQQEPLSMGWCLDCHRAPENHLRPISEVTTMGYVPAGGDQIAVGQKLKADNQINPPVHCSGCHR